MPYPSIRPLLVHKNWPARRYLQQADNELVQGESPSHSEDVAARQGRRQEANSLHRCASQSVLAGGRGGPVEGYEPNLTLQS